jgi:hypothetical protein
MDDGRGIDALFTKLDAPLLSARRTGQRRTFDMTKVCRSARLAKKPAIPAVERAQRNMCPQAGLLRRRVDSHRVGVA